MGQFLLGLLTAIIGYLLGNFSTGIVVSRLRSNTDIREYGSGNAGATNMLRVLGRRPAMWTLLGDVLKGIIASLIGFALLGVNGAVLGGTCAVLGHDFPVFFRFRGGKGVATSFGALLCIFPLQMLVILAIFLVVVALTRYVSLGSMCAAFVLPFLILFTVPGLTWFSYVLVFLLGGLCIFAHRKNIQRLLKKEESRLDFAQFSKKKETPQ